MPLGDEQSLGPTHRKLPDMSAADSCPAHGPDDVLLYWFGGDWRKNFQGKWFTRAGSPQRAAVDRDITEKFSSLLMAAECGKIVQGALNSVWDGTPRSVAAQIILLDQFSRHIYRFSRRPSPCCANETQETVRWEMHNGTACSKGHAAYDGIAENIDNNTRRALDLSLALLSSGEIDSLSVAGAYVAEADAMARSGVHLSCGVQRACVRHHDLPPWRSCRACLCDDADAPRFDHQVCTTGA